MEDIIKTLESMKNGNRYHDFVLDDAIANIKNTQEALLNPSLWYENQQINTKTFLSLFPQIYFTQQRLLALERACETPCQDPTDPLSNQFDTCSVCESSDTIP
jgi:hypothetical protein